MSKQATNNAALANSIARYKARRAKRMDEAEAENAKTKGLTPEELIQLVKDRRDRRDAEGDPENTEAAMGVIAQQDEDLDTLLDVIGTMMAQSDLGSEENTDGEDESESEESGSEENANGDDDGEGFDEETENNDGEGDSEEENDDCGENEDEDDDKPKGKADRKDSLSEHLSICRVGDKLHLDGLDRMSVTEAKKAVIRKARPNVRLDGKDKAYVDAAYDIVVQELKERKSTDFQRSQMMNGSKRRNDAAESTADEARKRMIDRNQRKEGTK